MPRKKNVARKSSKRGISIAKSSIIARVMREIELAKGGLVGLDSYYKDPSTSPGGVYGRSDNPVFGKSDPPSHSKSDSLGAVIDMVINPRELVSRPSVRISNTAVKGAAKARAMKSKKA